MNHHLSRARQSTSALVAALLISGAAAHAQQPLNVYGYFSTRLEKVYSEPGFNGSQVVKESAPRELGYPFFNVMLQHQLSDRFKAFVNLNGSDADLLSVSNMWGEMSVSPFLNIRVGKIYRKFGLYNELLDAVPTYYGIEPPETFDSDHLVISRTTTVMLHGHAPAGPGLVSYSVSTDNGESGGLVSEGTVPLGGDVNYRFSRGRYTLGVSGYTSGGRTGPDKALGDGSPKSGVLPWMESDKFQVVNVYGEARVENLTLQAEYAQAMHDGRRDPASVVALAAAASLNDAQLSRMFADPAGDLSDPANVLTTADYDVKTWYVRVGYSVYTSRGEIGPYVQWDWYSNPETIASKTYGGDNEAGVADDGVFNKGTIGFLFRPIPQVAIKLDGSAHFYEYMGQRVHYPEMRLDVSYTFGL